MKTTYFERITTKNVTVQQDVRETAEVPMLDLVEKLRIEVMNWPTPRGSVILNGTLLVGAVLKEYEVKRPFGHYGGERISVTIGLPWGTMVLTDVTLTTNCTTSPDTVEWKEKPVCQCVEGHQSVGRLCPVHCRPIPTDWTRKEST